MRREKILESFDYDLNILHKNIKIPYNPQTLHNTEIQQDHILERTTYQ